MDNIELLPCPFCGKKELSIESQPSKDGSITWHRIIHFATSSCGISLTDTNLKHLVNQWNTRAASRPSAVWVRVEYGLPNHKEIVQCFGTVGIHDKEPKVYRARFYKGNEYNLQQWVYGPVDVKNVTHWMRILPPESGSSSLPTVEACRAKAQIIDRDRGDGYIVFNQEELDELITFAQTPKNK